MSPSLTVVQVCRPARARSSSRVGPAVDVLGNHDGGQIGDRRRNSGDDGGICNAKVLQPAHGTNRVDYRRWVGGTAHRDRRGWMTVRREVGGDHLGQRLVADSIAGYELTGLKWTEHRTTSQVAADLHRLQ